jgi:hypothetical protein
VPNLGRWCFVLVLVVVGRALTVAFGPTLILAGMALGFLVVAFVWLLVDERWPAASPLRRAMPCVVVLATAWLAFASCPPFSEVATWPLGEQVRLPAPLDPTVRYASFYTTEDVWDVDLDRLPGRARGKRANLYLGNTAQYSGLEFINGYSPTRPAGLEQTLPFREHGYVARRDGERFLREQTGPRGLLQLLAVDGLVVSDSFAASRPVLLANGWEETAQVEGGRVFHRKGPRSPRVRALASDERFAPPRLSLVEQTRNATVVDVASPAADETLIVFSRPWYPGFRATLEGKPVPVEVASLVLPAVRLPHGARGRLMLEYRPRSLVVGAWSAVVTAGCLAVVWVVALLCRARRAATMPAGEVTNRAEALAGR